MHAFLRHHLHLRKGGVVGGEESVGRALDAAIFGDQSRHSSVLPKAHPKQRAELLRGRMVALIAQERGRLVPRARWHRAHTLSTDETGRESTRRRAPRMRSRQTCRLFSWRAAADRY